MDINMEDNGQAHQGMCVEQEENLGQDFGGTEV